jgi:DNA-binding response OmpR family regulator
MARILIAEDEFNINKLIRMNLELGGHTCVQVYRGDDAVACAKQEEFDLMILDVMMPGLDGYEVLEQLQGIPAIFVTAKIQLEDRIKGLRLGADDYILKPFDITELTERVNAVLRRTTKIETEFSFDDITVDFCKRLVYKNGELVKLKPKEYDLLEALIRNRNLALSREQLVNKVWGYDYDGELRTVDVHVQKLRLKLGMDQRLKTIHRVGYRLEV